MIILVLFAILSAIYAYFAVQNTIPISITFANFTLYDIPLYIVLGVSILAGFILSWLFYFIESISSNLELKARDKALKEARKTIGELTRRINQLHIENHNLKKKVNKDLFDEKSI